MIIIVGKFTFPSRELAQQAFEKSSEGSALAQQGKGVVWYSHALCNVDPTVLWALHVWETPEDVERHVSSDYYPALNAAATDGAISVEIKQWVGMEAYLRRYKDYGASS